MKSMMIATFRMDAIDRAQESPRAGESGIKLIKAPHVLRR